MARSLYRTLIRTSQPGIIVPKSPPSPHASRFVSLRTQSSQSENFQDFDSDQREALAVQKIEDAIHRIIVKRSAPDWLPFVPGSSYWVPPQRRTYGIADLVDKLANSLTEEEVMSLTTARGWPSSAFFLTDASTDPADIETASRNPSQSEDKDG
ncbi:hypothetical protein LOK49_LG14G02296 [Camellia lanceoleosa]|uniref:Uncharacterized protein n=1 Tax=Camellia lanceoleosa TaxID=1840588 RepID=A0ACC0FC16_9ERIC|nr:hypothetical protein LOK49_LG14G02296 [Camellia lanceoleosa]